MGALTKYGKLEIFNKDHGSQNTFSEFSEILIRTYIKISMQGKGRALDSVFL